MGHHRGRQRRRRLGPRPKPLQFFFKISGIGGITGDFANFLVGRVPPFVPVTTWIFSLPRKRLNTRNPTNLGDFSDEKLSEKCEKSGENDENAALKWALHTPIAAWEPPKGGTTYVISNINQTDGGSTHHTCRVFLPGSSSRLNAASLLAGWREGGKFGSRRQDWGDELLRIAM